MCLDATMFFDQNWLESKPSEAPVQVPEHEYAFPLHLELDSFYTWAAELVQAQAPEPPPAPPEPEWSRARADVFVLTIETELYAAVMYDKRKLIDQHALSTI